MYDVNDVLSIYKTDKVKEKIFKAYPMCFWCKINLLLSLYSNYIIFNDFVFIEKKYFLIL